MFLHYLLQQDADSLLFKFLNSQIEEAVKGDWINYIYEDLKELEITWSLEQIQSQSTNIFKSHVKEKTEICALNWLNKEKSQLSKVQQIQHKKLSIQEYLLPNSLDTKMMKLLFSLRSRMIPVRGNFKNKYKNDLICRICKSEPELQQHILSCKELIKNTTFLMDENTEYCHIYSNNVEKQAKITVLYENLYNLRNKLIKKDEIQ